MADDLAAELEENKRPLGLSTTNTRARRSSGGGSEDAREADAREAAASLVREEPGSLGDDGEEVREEPGGLGDGGEEDPDSDAALDAAALELEVTPGCAGRFLRQCTRRPGAWVGF